METYSLIEEPKEQTFHFELSADELQDILFLLKEKDKQSLIAQKLIEKLNEQGGEVIIDKPRSYSQFTLDTVISNFALKPSQNSHHHLFEEVSPIEASEELKRILERNEIMPLTSEKSRGEAIIFPILTEVATQNKGNFTFFSGERLDVDAKRGLTGECDYLMSHYNIEYFLESPVFALVEAKKSDIVEGLGQCVAQMIGAREFNKQHNRSIPSVYGCVSNGEIWQFLKLNEEILIIDKKKYYLNETDKILGIFQFIIEEFMKSEV